MSHFYLFLKQAANLAKEVKEIHRFLTRLISMQNHQFLFL